MGIGFELSLEGRVEVTQTSRAQQEGKLKQDLQVKAHWVVQYHWGVKGVRVPGNVLEEAVDGVGHWESGSG